MVNLLIVNNAERGIAKFVEPLQHIAAESGAVPTAIQYEETLTTEMSSYDGVILSGSPRGNDIVDHHLPYFQWIKSSENPLLGICAGHHIVGKLYGAQLLRSVEKEIGENSLFIRQRDPIFNGCPDRFPVHQNHHDSITLPGNFILLASSENCRVSMMKHHEKPVYTTQFHPEILNKNLVLNFIEIVKTYKRRQND